MTAVVVPAETWLDPDQVAYWYQVDPQPPAIPFKCWCGKPAAGRTSYGTGNPGRAADRVLFHCPDHLPAESMIYTVEDRW